MFTSSSCSWWSWTTSGNKCVWHPDLRFFKWTFNFVWNLSLVVFQSSSEGVVSFRCSQFGSQDVGLRGHHYKVGLGPDPDQLFMFSKMLCIFTIWSSCRCRWCWIPSWLPSWCPTSQNHLKAAEDMMLRCKKIQSHLGRKIFSSLIFDLSFFTDLYFQVLRAPF